MPVLNWMGRLREDLQIMEEGNLNRDKNWGRMGKEEDRIRRVGGAFGVLFYDVLMCVNCDFVAIPIILCV